MKVFEEELKRVEQEKASTSAPEPEQTPQEEALKVTPSEILSAFDRIVRVLKPLDPEKRRRVLRAVAIILDMEEP